MVQQREQLDSLLNQLSNYSIILIPSIRQIARTWASNTHRRRRKQFRLPFRQFPSVMRNMISGLSCHQTGGGSTGGRVYTQHKEKVYRARVLAQRMTLRENVK